MEISEIGKMTVNVIVKKKRKRGEKGRKEKQKDDRKWNGLTAHPKRSLISLHERYTTVTRTSTASFIGNKDTLRL